MAIFDQFSYTNFHELNLDTILSYVTQIKDKTENIDASVAEANAAAESAQLSAESIKELFVTPEMYGAAGDGITDDSDAINQAIQNGNNIVMAKSYFITSPIIINKKVDLLCSGKIIYNGANSAIIVTYSNCNINIKEIETSNNGIEMRPANDSTLTNCQWDIIKCDLINCTGNNGIALFLNAVNGAIQFCSFFINRMQSNWVITNNKGIYFKTATGTNHFCNGNVFNVYSICYMDTALYSDVINNTCISNQFNNVHFEHNNTAIDMPNTLFYLLGCFDEATGGNIKITNGTIALIEVTGRILETRFNYTSISSGNFVIKGRIINSAGIYLTDNLLFNSFGVMSKGIVTPVANVTNLTGIISDTIVRYLSEGDVLELPALRKAGTNENPIDKITLLYSTVSGSPVNITINFSDGTTTSLLTPAYRGALNIMPNGSNTGQWVF